MQCRFEGCGFVVAIHSFHYVHCCSSQTPQLAIPTSVNWNDIPAENPKKYKHKTAPLFPDVVGIPAISVRLSLKLNIFTLN